MEGPGYRRRARTYIDNAYSDTAKSHAGFPNIPEFDEFKSLSFDRVIEELDVESHKGNVQRVGSHFYDLTRHL